MPFPNSRRVVYRRNPLVEVICQLRFPTILDIKASEPAPFQELIRRSGYPLYERGDSGVPKDVEDLLAKLPLTVRPNRMIHKFLTEDSSRSISLTSDFVALTERDYKRWESFREQMLIATEALEEVYHPAFYTRIGLRYQNLIDKIELGLADTPWSSLVNPDIVGILSREEMTSRAQQVESRSLLSLDDQVKGAFVMLRHGLVDRTDGQLAYTIDADFFTEERSDHDKAFEILNRFNSLDGNLFRWAITRVLKRALGSDPIR